MRSLLLLSAVLLVSACGTDTAPDADSDVVTLTGYDLFWDNLMQQCGEAFEGTVTKKPEGDTQLSEDAELIVHFRECSGDELRLPLHVLEGDMDDWNRSRTWVITPHEEGLELRHDHRTPDGTTEDNTGYGAVTLGDTDGTTAEFIGSGRDGEGPQTGWRIEIEPGERFTYGTIRNGNWRYRLDFDLTEPIDPPPAPWGFEGQANAGPIDLPLNRTPPSPERQRGRGILQTTG